MKKNKTLPCLTAAVTWVGCVALSMLYGCGDPGPRRRPPAVAPGAERASEEKPEQTAPGDDSSPDAAASTSAPASDNAPATAASAAQPAAAAPPSASIVGPIRLSAGVALPQALPTGTVMAFSVDYEFIEGGPQPAFQYLWIIQAAEAAEPWEAPVQLSGRDTLQTFVADLHPRHGPFETFIAEVRPDGSRRAVSPVEPLKSDAR